MKKLAVALLVGALGGGFCLAQNASTVSSDIDGVGQGLFFTNSIHYDTTFCNYENEYDFFYQPWELTDIQFDRTSRLGNNHAMSDGGYKALYWAQFANNNVQNSGSSAGSLDVLTAATLFHAGPGLFGVSAAIAGAEDKTSVNGTTVSDDSTDLSELYLTWGMNATDKISWGVALDVYNDKTDSGVAPASTTDETTSYLVKGGVKFRTRDDFWWSVRAQIGQPEVKFDDDSGPTHAKEDGDTFGVGGDVNWVFDGWDLEVDADYLMNDWSVDATSGGVNLLDSDDVSEDLFRVQARASYKIGRAELWKSLKIVSGTRDVDLVDTGAIVDKFEVDEFLVQPSAAIRFPFGCKDCSVKIAGIVGAGWTLSSGEEKTTFGANTSKDEFTSSDGAIRLGLEVTGERFAFDAMWENDNSSIILNRGSSFSSSSFGRDGVNNNRIIVGATIKL